MDGGLRLLRGTRTAFSRRRGSMPHTRLVQHLVVADGGTVWIGTTPRSRKAADVAANPRVTYAVEDLAAFAWVSIEAHATLAGGEADRLAK
jgi:general stress protein 26